METVRTFNITTSRGSLTLDATQLMLDNIKTVCNLKDITDIDESHVIHYLVHSMQNTSEIFDGKE